MLKEKDVKVETCRIIIQYIQQLNAIEDSDVILKS